MELINILAGFIIGFFTCLCLWCWVEYNNAKRENGKDKI